MPAGKCSFGSFNQNLSSKIRSAPLTSSGHSRTNVGGRERTGIREVLACIYWPPSWMSAPMYARRCVVFKIPESGSWTQPYILPLGHPLWRRLTIGKCVVMGDGCRLRCAQYHLSVRVLIGRIRREMRGVPTSGTSSHSTSCGDSISGCRESGVSAAGAAESTLHVDAPIRRARISSIKVKLHRLSGSGRRKLKRKTIIKWKVHRIQVFRKCNTNYFGNNLSIFQINRL